MNKKKTIAKLRREIESVYPHFDKVVLRADADLSFLDLKRLTNLDTKKQFKPVIEHKAMSFNSGFKYKLTLYQPSPENIQYFCDAISTESVNIFISYAEITYDFICQDPAAIAKIINAHLVHLKRGSAYHHEHEGTHYWGKRPEKNSPDIFPATYHDRESKIAHLPCFHLEYRMYSKPMCETHQLSVPSDLISFDHINFFYNNTVFFATPTKCQIGKAYAEVNGVTCDTDRGYEKLFGRMSVSKVSKLDKPIISLGDTVQQMLFKMPNLKAIIQKSKRKDNQEVTLELQNALLYRL